jgi:hypothetical protein
MANQALAGKAMAARISSAATGARDVNFSMRVGPAAVLPWVLGYGARAPNVPHALHGLNDDRLTGIGLDFLA